ncbi:glycoside hydrolase domain-containing protein [Amycolatopsis rubida]|uniref:Rv2525c-like glycoside hydrolase-like domain-containing protein n=1 Tax=Amycolatopsis rubida TaxID=112413 RepID=A0A1I6AHY4_9PSEU|nr:glycoside hydrolase domain-containing protein [Amycolatopsis rubida]SFQ68272.1 protein of unknown function [Amycolatopsis rubida]
MADPKVLEAQKWVNATYGAVAGYRRCPEDGRPAWSTMYSLTRALQHELGIADLTDAVGPLTLSKLAEKGPLGPGFANDNIIRIAQHALFCKGYWGGDTYGRYDASTAESVNSLRSDTGVGNLIGTVDPKLFKAILTMDAYVLLAGGTEQIRHIQQWLNGSYAGKSTYFIGPCDGLYSRDVQKALVKALQYEFGIPESDVNGNFGPATKAGLRNHPLQFGDSGIFVQLFSAACVFNGTVDNTSTAFKSTFDGKLVEWVKAFQVFSALESSGRGDYPTWAQLLISTGDQDRPAGAGDTRHHISVDRAKALKAAGYHVVGRYLDEPPDSTLDKEIQPGELEAIFAGDMRVFPIWQYNSRRLEDFTYAQGHEHARRAHDRALGYGFNAGTVIYFAVDYDATGEEITSNVVPYFLGVQAGLGTMGRRYIPGVYGSRNVCAQVSSHAYTRFSFVSGMSWGFSGNLGFPLPSNWSFNQIKEIRFSAGGDTFDWDRDVMNPRAGSDRGAGPENVNGRDSALDRVFRYIDELFAAALRYNRGDPSLRVLEYLRYPHYVDLYDGWQTLIGDVDRDWISYAQANGPAKLDRFNDTAGGVSIDLDHLGATANAVLLKGGGSGIVPGRGDFGGWGGDLCTFYGEWRAHSEEYASGYLFCKDRLAKITVPSTFTLDDLIEDVDGYLVGTAVRNGVKITDAVRTYLGGDGPTKRFANFFALRHGGAEQTVFDLAWNMLTGNTYDDLQLTSLRWLAIKSTSGMFALAPESLPKDKLTPFVQGYAELIKTLASP